MWELHELFMGLIYVDKTCLFKFKIVVEAIWVILHIVNIIHFSNKIKNKKKFNKYKVKTRKYVKNERDRQRVLRWSNPKNLLP